MSQILELEEHLQRYWQMDHHRNPLLSSTLDQVQAWQKQRMQKTHAALFSEPGHAKLAAYFLNRLYGSPEFAELARELERILFRAKKIERIVPDNALTAGSTGIALALLAVELDEEVARFLIEHELDITERNMAHTYKTLGQDASRHEQMSQLSTLCYLVEKYVRSAMLQTAFKMSRSVAYRHNFKLLYDFIAEGFEAMKTIKSMPKFIEPFCARELILIEQVRLGVPHPFDLPGDTA